MTHAPMTAAAHAHGALPEANERDAQAREWLLRRLELATRVANIGVWERDLARGREVLDDAACRILGFGSGPQVRAAADFVACVHGDDRARLIDDTERMLAGRRADTEPLEFRTLRDGEVRHLLAHYAVERDALGAPQRLLGTLLDITDLRRAEAAARVAAERLQIATRLGGLSVFERDADDRLIHFDGLFGAIYGAEPGRDRPEIEAAIQRVHADDRAAFVAARDRMRAADEPVRCEYRALAADGSVRDLLSWRRRRTDAQGRYAGEIGALIDITELRAAERRARETGAWLAVATAAAGLGVWEIEAQGERIVADERAHDLFAGLLRPSPTAVAAFEALLAPEERTRVRAALKRAREAGGELVDAEFRVRLPHGERLLAARGKAVPGEGGVRTRLMGVIWDATAERAAAEQARTTAERLQLAAVGAGIGSWERSFDGGFSAWDEAMYRLFGAGADDGSPNEIARRCVLPEEWPAIDRARLQALRSGEFAHTYRIRRGDGQIRWLSARGRTRFDAGGAPVAIAGVAWDVTEAHEHDAARRAKETAERANHAKSEFLSRMSHELRTPLNAIVGFTQLLEIDPSEPLSATQRERVGLIRDAGMHLLNLVNDVLDLARIESGRSTVAMQVVAWRGLLDEAMAMVQPQAAARGIEMRAGGDGPRKVWADPVRLRQVLLNLLSNAVNFNRDRGTVQVRARADGDALVLAVADSGHGIAPERIERLFQPFDRLGLGAAAPAGTGIGLTISHRLMQQMGGAIEVDSTPGAGSEFRLRLRAAHIDDAPAAAPPAARPAPSVRDDLGGTLLYIEDNPTNAALVEQFLQFRPRVRLYLAADGATGLVMASVCRPDAVLIDLRLPDMGGEAVLRELQRRPAARALPCIAVSAEAMAHDVQAALAAGFSEYWTKPLDLGRFLSAIDRLLAAAAAEDKRQR